MVIKVKDFKPKYQEIELFGKGVYPVITNFKYVVSKYGEYYVQSKRDFEDTKTTSLNIAPEEVEFVDCGTDY